MTFDSEENGKTLHRVKPMDLRHQRADAKRHSHPAAGVVVALYPGEDEYCPGIVTALNADGTIAILCDDGDTANVPRHHVEVDD